MPKPRAYTKAEVKDKFLTMVASYVDYWDKLPERDTVPGLTGTRSKLEGLAFSMLVILDGGSVTLPGFIVTPNTSDEDRADCVENDMNFYPDDLDIAGSLHDNIHKYFKKDRT